MEHEINNGECDDILIVNPLAIDPCDYLSSFPSGYRFNPLDHELIHDYLRPKIDGEPLPVNLMHEINIYNHNPEKLTEYLPTQGEKTWYFFTPRDKKYRNGTRPSRKADDGYWKATGADRQIYKPGGKDIIGYRKALVFYIRQSPKDLKTNWIMHEFRIFGPSQANKRKRTDINEDTSMRLDDYVLCRIYKKEEGYKQNKSQGKQVVVINENYYQSQEDASHEQVILQANQEPLISTSEVDSNNITTLVQPPCFDTDNNFINNNDSNVVNDNNFINNNNSNVVNDNNFINNDSHLVNVNNFINNDSNIINGNSFIDNNSHIVHSNNFINNNDSHIIPSNNFINNNVSHIDSLTVNGHNFINDDSHIVNGNMIYAIKQEEYVTFSPMITNTSGLNYLFDSSNLEHEYNFDYNPSNEPPIFNGTDNLQISYNKLISIGQFPNVSDHFLGSVNKP